MVAAAATLAAARGEEIDDRRREARRPRDRARVVARLRLLGESPQITVPDLSALVEAALIEQAATTSPRRS